MTKAAAKFQKGDMVELTPAADRTGSLWSSFGDDGSTAEARYHCTAADVAAWHDKQARRIAEAREAGEDTFHIAMNDAGESRLPPRSGTTKLFAGTPYRVLRARCRESFSYYNATGGWAKLLDLNTGREVYIDRTKLQKVEA